MEIKKYAHASFGIFCYRSVVILLMKCHKEGRSSRKRPVFFLFRWIIRPLFSFPQLCQTLLMRFNSVSKHFIIAAIIFIRNYIPSNNAISNFERGWEMTYYALEGGEWHTSLSWVGRETNMILRKLFHWLVFICGD